MYFSMTDIPFLSNLCNMSHCRGIAVEVGPRCCIYFDCPNVHVVLSGNVLELMPTVPQMVELISWLIRCKWCMLIPLVTVTARLIDDHDQAKATLRKESCNKAHASILPIEQIAVRHYSIVGSLAQFILGNYADESCSLCPGNSCRQTWGRVHQVGRNHEFLLLEHLFCYVHIQQVHCK